MADYLIYLSDEERDWVRSQEKGLARKLIQDAIDDKQFVKEGLEALEKVPKIVEVRDGLNTCKNCGAMLPYFKGKCKLC